MSTITNDTISNRDAYPTELDTDSRVAAGEQKRREEQAL